MLIYHTDIAEYPQKITKSIYFMPLFVLTKHYIVPIVDVCLLAAG